MIGLNCFRCWCSSRLIQVKYLSMVMPCNTFVNEIVAVFNMLQADKQLGHESFACYCIATGHRVPSVILYTECQLSQTARRLLCVLASSGQSEWDFSSGDALVPICT